MWVCLDCNRSYSDHCKCEKCGGNVVNIPLFLCGNTQCIATSNKSTKWKRPSDIRSKKIRREEIPGFDVFGALPKHVRILIYGKYGSGKSTFALKFINEVSKSNWRGKAIYVSAEEGVESATLQQKLEQQKIDSANLIIVDNIDDMWEAVRDEDAHNVVIDSLHRSGITVAKATEIFDAIPGICVLVAHSRKDDNYKGDSGFAHDCDIVAVAKFGKLFFDKNRFCMVNRTYNIWPSPI